jgi:hypothetical protein
VTTTVTGGSTTINNDGFRHYNYSVIFGIRSRYTCTIPQAGFVDCDACDTTGLNTPCVPYGWQMHGRAGTVYQCINYLKTPIGTLSFSPFAGNPNYGQIRNFDGNLDPSFQGSTRTLYAMGTGAVIWWWRQTAPVPWPAGDVGPRSLGFISGFTKWITSVCGPLVNCSSMPTGTCTPLTDVDKSTLNLFSYPTAFPVDGGTPAPIFLQPPPW